MARKIIIESDEEEELADPPSGEFLGITTSKRPT